MDIGRILRISKWEVTEKTPSLNRRTIAYAVIGMLLISVVAGLSLSYRTSSSEGLYAVGVNESSPYHSLVTDSTQFRPVDPSVEKLRDGQQDLIVRDGKILVSPTEKGRAAHTEFKAQIRSHNDRLMRQLDNSSRAFPLEITVHYISPAGDVDEQAQEVLNATNGGGGTVQDEQDVNRGVIGTIQHEARSVFGMSTTTTANTPGGLTPPFPFESLMLSLLFLIPLNFVAQAYGSNMMSERINRRGEMLLGTPATGMEIVTGKTLPYLLLMTAISALIAGVFGGGVWAVVAMIPLQLVMLAGVFIAAMFARSFKDLTFVTTALSVSVISYAFVPAMFVDVHPIAVISPLTIVVQSLQPTATITVIELLFGILPLTLLSSSLFILGVGLYREEDLFSQKSIRAKVLDAIYARFNGLRSMLPITVILLPIVFASELLLVAGVFPLPTPLNIGVLFLGIAIIEELAKSLPSRAAFANHHYDPTTWNGVKLGAASGASFFVVEKVVAVVQLVGMQQLDVGQAAFGDALVSGAQFSGPAGLLLFLAPLALHVTATTVASIGARKGTRWYAAGIALAVIIHGIYNITIITTLG